MKKTTSILLILMFFMIVVAGCKNPMIGLGPAADITSPSGGIDLYVNGDYVRGQITLKGTSTDDVKIESVKAVLNAKVFEAELTQGEITLWSIPIDTTAYADGEYTIVFTISDSSGRETEKRLLLYFDNTAPTVMVTSTVGITSGASTNAPLIRGEAYDYLFSRIDHIEATVLSGNAEIISFQGTNGWNLNLKTTGTGTYSVRVTAFDTAGNSNNWLYHSKDLPVNTKIEDVAAADKSGTLGSLNLARLRQSSQDVSVDLSLDEPRLVISNPEEGKTADGNVLGGTSSAVGYIEDDDEVDAASIELSVDGGTIWQSLSGSQLSGSGGFIRWSYDLSALENGVYSLQIKAKDTNKEAGDAILTGYSAIVPFTMDKTAPSVQVNSPEPGSYHNTGNFTITGEARDIGGTVESLKISINGGPYESASSNPAPAESINWSHVMTGAPAGAVDIKVEAVDNSGKSSHYNMQVYVDTDPPKVEFLSPQAGLFINGTTRLQGVSSDNWSLAHVKLQIGGLSWAPDVAEVLPPSEFYSWQRNIVSSNYENTGMAVEVNGSGNPEVGTGIWELKIWAEAVDKAGNARLEQHKIYIDNSLDRPGINIASPADKSVLAGSVMLSGSAWDDKNEAGETLDHIEIRVWKGQDGTGGNSTFSECFDLNNLMSLEDVYGDDSWYKVEGTSTWSIDLNGEGEFYPNSADHNGTAKIDVRAVDQKGGIADLAGNIQSVEVTFDDTVPYFDAINYTSGAYASGTIDLRGTVKDDDSVERLRISYNGGVDWTTIGTSLGASYNFSQSINTIEKIGDSGILYLRLEALDTANYKTLAGINLNVDNLAPSGSYTASLADLSGTALVQGTASDSGTVAGVDRVEISFKLDGNVVKAKKANGAEVDKIVIDSRTEVGVDDSLNGDRDGFNESMTLSGSTWTWWAEFDTTDFPDGVLEVIYTVIDNAGNEYTRTVGGDGVGNIKNHAPVLSSMSIGWDHNHDGIVSGDESDNYNLDITESNSIFGSLYYDFNTVYDNLNGDLDHGIRIRTWDPDNIEIPGTWIDIASVVESGMLNTSSNTVFVNDDDYYEIEFSVEDEKGYSSRLNLKMRVENNDIFIPTMDFYELNEINAAAVKASGIGHIEIDGTIDPDIYLSGRIPFSGRAEDNKRIESIRMKVGSSSEVVIAAWDSVDNRLKYTADNEAVGEFIEVDGRKKHRVDWAYEWDSSTLPAKIGAKIQFIVEDAPNDGDTNGRIHFIEHTYNVVPYIASIEAALSSSLSNSLSRSALGKYPVLIETTPPTYESVTVKGWNIDSSVTGTTTDIRLSDDPDGLADDGTLLTDVELTFSGTGDDSNEILVNIEADGSGWLSIIINGVATRNNNNSNSKSYNIEPSETHQTLTDDRYLSLWDITRIWQDLPLADHAEYPTMTMNGGAPNFAYVNNSMGYGQAFYYDGTTNKQFIENWDLFTYTAIDLNDSGKQGALVDLNIVNGNFGDFNAGNYGGIFVNFFYDVPYYNWYNYSFRDNGVWLDNLVDESSGTTAVLNRYQYPDILLDGPDTATDVFYSVYDNLEQRLIFRHFKVGTNSSVNTGSGGRINDEDIALYTNIKQQNRYGDWPSYDNVHETQVDRTWRDNDAMRFIKDDETSPGQPGATPPGAQYVSTTATKFSAVGATSGETPDSLTAVIAYYDTSGSGKLVFRYNTNPDDANEWSDPITIDQFVDAQYIDLKVDANDHIHLAYYDSFHGDVKYAYIPAFDSGESAVELYTVDSYLIVGSKLTLDLSSSNKPYISYKGLGNTARVAWLSGPAGHGAVGNKFTGTWEIQTVPNIIADTDSNRFNIGVDAAGLPVVGYTDDGLEYVRLLPELTN